MTARIKDVKLFLSVRVAAEDSDSIVETEVYKFINGKEALIGMTDKQGHFRITTLFSSPDTFSFISPSYRKTYLYVQ